ncbi:MAG: helix-turn-helix domain-containing protein [Streptosporangiaceae bacterium]
MPGEYVPDFDGLKARAIREQHGWTRRDVAESVPCAIPTLARWERGEIKPTPENFAELARALRVERAELRTPGSARPDGDSRHVRLASRPGESRADFIARLISDAPALSRDERQRIGALLRRQ